MAKTPTRANTSRARRRVAGHRVDMETVRPRGERLWRRLRRDRNWLRLVLLVVVAGLLVVVVDGGGPPLTYRLGQTPFRDITVKTAFDRIDRIETANRRRRAEMDAPPVLVHDAGRMAAIVKDVEDLIVSASRTIAVEKLPEGIRATWSVSQAELDALRVASGKPEAGEPLVARLRRALAAIGAKGILDRKTFRETLSKALRLQQGQALPHVLQLISPDTGEPGPTVLVEEVDLAALRDPRADGNPLAAALSDLDPETAKVIFGMVAKRLEPTLVLDEQKTKQAREAARARVDAARIHYDPGWILVEAGHEIRPEEMELLKLEHEAYLAGLTAGDKLQRLGAIAVVILMMLLLVGGYGSRSEPDLARGLPRLVSLGLLVVVAAWLARLCYVDPWRAHLLPLMLAAMMITLVFSPLSTLLVCACLVLLASIALGLSPGGMIAALAATVAAAFVLGRIRNRLTLVKAGTAVGVAAAVATMATAALEYTAWRLAVEDTIRALACGRTAGFFISGSLPLVERLFGIVTDISLLELSDASHPLMQLMVQKAPGTYSHSNGIASLAENAAEAIGANGLLCRVGSYYHDIGKAVKPDYFVENQSGAENRHHSLAPAMSTLVIIGHVKDGVDLAHQHNLPDAVIRFIEEHHGTTLVEYFYHEAAKRHGGKEPVDDSVFRYPGPKPSSKETAILMLCDTVESAARTLSDPNPGSIEGLVDKLVTRRLSEGQLDDSGLTLTDVGRIKQSLVKSLIAVYHGRVKYPQEATA